VEINKKMKWFHILTFNLVVASVLPAMTRNKKVDKLFSELQIEKLSEEAAPDFKLTTLDGDTISLRNNQNKLIILHFWATWCKPCRKEMPELENLAQKLNGLPVTILGISIDEATDSNKVKQAVGELGISFPIAAKYTGKISDVYWTWGIPATYLVGASGKILGRMLGPRRWNDTKMLELLQLLVNTF
jgi:peroxiredoxin